MADETPAAPCEEIDPDRPLIIGVLPHPFCNPRVRGCGFCTFPHEPYCSSAATQVAHAVIAEMEGAVARLPALTRKPVAGLYIGGGTANLTPPAAFEALCASLAEHFDLSGAEITLEGVPRYFLTHDRALLTVLRDRLPARHLRLSLGIQSFDPQQIARMGRQAFGGTEHVAEVARLAHEMGLTVSGDLLINLPAQSAEEVLADIAIADELGLDQICLYHLVAFPGLDTEWSQDAATLRVLPAREQALATWTRARRELFRRSFVQTTLTNFERAPVARSTRRFEYERCSFHPDVYDGVGFGPGAISTFSGAGMEWATKTINATGAAEYVAAVAEGGGAARARFDYEAQDRKLLFLTRSLPLMAISRPTYRALFGADLCEDFRDAVAAIRQEKLASLTAAELRLTAQGMFYADSIAGLLASRRVAALRRRMPDAANDAAELHMG